MKIKKNAALARLEALENDNARTETVEMNDDYEASLDDDDHGNLSIRTKGYLIISTGMLINSMLIIKNQSFWQLNITIGDW